MDPYQYADNPPDDDYYSRIAQILDRARAGESLGAGDRQILDEALTRFAPSDPMYRRIAQTKGYGATTFDEGQDNVMPGKPNPESGFGWPTLDFLMGSDTQWGPGGVDTRGHHEPGNTRPATEQPSPAEVHDAEVQGQGNTDANTMGPIGMGGFHGPGMPPNYLDEFDLGPYMQTAGGEDMSFADTPLSNRELIYQDPSVYANILYEDMPGKQNQMMPYLAAAREMANSGALTGEGNTLHSGPGSPTAQLALMEQMMTEMDQPGMQFIDPDAVFADTLSRAANTDMQAAVGSQGNIYDQIDLTKQAMLQAGPFMTGEGRQVLEARLDRAAVEYMTALAKGEIGPDVSFPKYLQDNKAMDWLQE